MGFFHHVQITTSMLIITSLNISCQGFSYGPIVQDNKRPIFLGFFGSKYQCHCTKGCDSSGNCTGESNECDRQWFGLACQYQNLAYSYISNILPPEAQPLFTTWDNAKCRKVNLFSTIIITWNMSLPFSWMRFEVGSTLMFDTLNVSFRAANMTKMSCVNQTLLQVDEKTFDIHCDLDTAMKQIYIEGDIVKSMCYIRINGGRNFALRQKASQSSQLENYEAKYAVDGYVKEHCHGQCSHTMENDQNPSWTVTFDQPYIINKFVIYNRYDAVWDRLNKFDIEVFNQEGKTIFNYQDGNSITQQVYTILYPNVDPVYEVTVSQRHIYYDRSVPIVTINEFQAYGECLDGTWGLGCNNTCNSSCKYSCNKDDGTCNKVCIPNTNPPRCVITDCDTGKYGPNCALNCSDACLGQRCDSTNGHCLNCADGQYTPFCEVCPFGSYGANCSKNCSDQCIESHKCDPVNGACYKGCKDGNTFSDCIDRNQSTNLCFSVSSLVSIIVGICSSTVLVIVIVWYVRRRKLRRQREFEIEIMYQKDGLISDSSTCVAENCDSKIVHEKLKESQCD